MFERFKRKRNEDGTFKMDVRWTPWNVAWSYKMNEELKDMLERAVWTFIEAFLGALVISPMVGIEASALEIAAISGGGAALSVIKTFAKKKIS